MRKKEMSLGIRWLLISVILCLLPFLFTIGVQDVAGLSPNDAASGPAQGTSEPGKVVRPSDFVGVTIAPTEFIEKPEEGEFPEEVMEALKANPPIPAGPKPKHVEDPRDGKGAPEKKNNFKGIVNSDLGPLPPDNGTAVGPSHVVEAVNDWWQIFDKRTGAPVTSKIPLCGRHGWWSSVFHPPSSKRPICTDPKVIYDHFFNRWIMVDLGLSLKEIGEISYYLLAVSHTSDPTGPWCVWALDAKKNGSATSSEWADYPGLGVDQEAIYITSNQFSEIFPIFKYAKLRIIAKDQLYDNTCGRITWTDFWGLKNPDETRAFTVQPARTYGDPGVEYLINHRSPTGNSLTLWTLTDPLDNPKLSRVKVPVGSYSIPPDAAQCRTETTIETNDARLADVIYRDGVLWAVHTIACPRDNKKACLHLVSIDVSDPDHPKVLDDFSYGAPSKGFSYYFPAIMVDESNNVYVMFNSSSDSQCVDIRYTGRLSGERSNTMPGSSLLKASSTKYEVIYKGRTIKRWGDYSGIALDPEDPNTVWFAGEYAHDNNKWGTWIGAISFKPKTTPTPSLSLEVDRGCGVSGSSYQVGENIVVTYSVGQDAAVTLYRLGHTAEMEVLRASFLTSGDSRALVLDADRAGVETIVLVAETSDGKILSKACTYSIGDVPLDKAEISIDKGCGATYHVGEPITLYLFVDEDSDVSVTDFATDGSISEIIRQHIQGGDTVTIPAQVVGPAGIDTLVMVAETAAGLRVTSACSLVIEE